MVHLWSSVVESVIDCKVKYFEPDKVEKARDWLLWPEGAVNVL